MADKYRVLSVKTPVSNSSSTMYTDTFTDWTELELVPYLGSMAAIGGYDARFKILISSKTNAELKPAEGDIIKMDVWAIAKQPPVVKQSPDSNLMTVNVGSKPMQTTIEDMIVQLKRLNDNLEKKN